MNIHFIAIGEDIMYRMAIAMAKNGHQVSGSDEQVAPSVKAQLIANGLMPETAGWRPEKIHTDLDAIVIGKQVGKDNPELNRAQELQIPVYSEAAFIFNHARQKQRIVIAGSAGKASVQDMILYVLHRQEKDTDYIMRTQVPGQAWSLRLSNEAPAIIIEGEGGPASQLDDRPQFCLYHAHMVVLVSLGDDPTMYMEPFNQLMQGLSKAADVIYLETDPIIGKLVKSFTDEELHYLHPYKAPSFKQLSDGVEVKLEGEKQKVAINDPKMLVNLAAAWKVCELLAIPIKDFLRHMSTYHKEKMD